MTIDQLPPVVRLRMVNARRDSMRGGLSSIVEELRAFAAQALAPDAKCHLRMLAAELAYLDGDQESALRSLTLEQEQLDSLSAPLRVTLLENRLVVELLDLRAYDHDSRRRNLDEKERLGTLDDDLDAHLVDALRAARNGKHYQALPQLRSYFIRAYWKGDWRMFRDAAREMSLELLALKDQERAASYAVEALDVGTAVAVARAFLTPTGATNFGRTLQSLMERGRLRQHARIVCAFIEASADGVPDDLVDTVAKYLLQWAMLGRGDVKSVNVADVAWDALGSIGYRVSASIADDAIAAATASVLWEDGSGVHREHVSKACKQLAVRASEEYLGQFVNSVVALATSERHPHDYEHLLGLLWRLSQRSTAAKEAILAAMFPAPGAPAPASLLQLGKLLGKELQNSEELNSFAERLAIRIRNQAVVVETGGQAPPGDGFGMVSFIHEGKQVVAQVSDFGSVMQGVLSYASELSTSAIGQLVDAMLEMIAVPWNLLANRAELAFYVGEFAPFVEERRIDNCVAVLMPIARGEAIDIAGREMGDPTDPLNAYKFNFGSKAELQALAIVSLAKLEKRRSGIATAGIEEIVVAGLAHSDPQVRRRSYVAATWLSAMPDAIVTGLLLGARDPVPEAAAAALGVFASENLGDRLAPSQIDYLIQAVDAASQTDQGVLRKQAATVASRLHLNEIAPRQARVLNGVLERLSRDPLHSVRAAVSRTAHEPEE